jgi:DNA-binding IclR family transcriptional regulator
MAASEHLRHRSKVLFGNADRLETVLHIARSDDGLVSATELVEACGMAQNRARAQLLALADAGLLDMAPRGPGPGRNYYLRRSSEIWDAIVRFAEAAEAEVARSVG